jgi:hypothetical protein
MALGGLDKINEPSVPTDGKSKLEYQDLYHKHRRKRRRANTVNWCFVIFIWICLIVVCAVVVIKVWHMVLPEKLYWLNKEQLAALNDFFVDGSIGGLLVGIFKSKIIESEDQKD